jgi:proline iminopeptidase
VRHVVTPDGVRLAVHDLGSGPPLLCVPGGPGRASSYLEDLGGLAGSRTLMLLDNRGTGGSDLPDDRASLQFPRLADDVEVVRAHAGQAPMDVLGHSAGCPVAVLHAIRRPDAVRRLVLVTPSGRPFGWDADDVEEIRAARAGEPWFAEAAEAQAAMEHVNPRLRSELEKQTRPFWYGRWDSRAQQHAAGADGQMSLRASAGYAPAAEYDASAARESLGAITAPTLVVVGERDALTGAAVADRFAEAIPDVRVARISDAGHFPWVDQPAAFRATVEDFLSAS